MNHGRGGKRSIGFTFVEMMTSLVIVSVLLVATGSAVVLATRALPGRESPTARALAAAAVLDRINSELSYAKSIEEMTPNAIAFTVADRTGDGVDDRIRFEWEAKAGAPLVRSFNGSEPAVLLDDVREFSLTYDIRKTALPQTFTLGNERLLFQQDPGLLNTDFAIDANNWIGQRIQPSLPPSTAWWTVTRVVLRARVRGSAAGETRIQVRDVDGAGLPGSIVHDQAVMLESGLPTSYQWSEYHLTRGTRLARNASIYIILRWVRDTESCEVQTRTSVSLEGAVTTSTGGATWSSLSTTPLILQVYGRRATLDPARHRYTLDSVRLTMRSGETAAGRINGSIITHNTPEVAAP